ncbi:MAG: EAL domain-containing protein [Pseudomonadota bacterium]
MKLARLTLSERALFAAVLAGIALLLIFSDVLWRWDRWLYDWNVSLWSPPSGDEVVIVAIDEESLESLGRWPWSRRVHAELIERLTEAGAKVIALDILFAEPDVQDPEGDALLARAVRDSGRVVLPVVQERLSANGQLVETLPFPPLAESAAGLGHVDVEPDADGVVRGVYLKAGLGTPHWPAFAAAILQTAGPVRSLPAGERHPNLSDASPYAWVRDHRIWIPFAGPPGHFPRVSYLDVLQRDVPLGRLHGRYVLVGTTVSGLSDVLHTPGGAHPQTMAGVEFNANLLDRLQRGALVTPLTKTWTAVVTLMLVLLPVLIFPRTVPRWSPMVACALMLLTAGVSALLFRFGLLWFAPAAALMTLALSYPLWSWRQMEHAQGYLRRELQRLRANPGVLASTSSPRDEGPAFLARILPLSGCTVLNAAGTPIVRWGRDPVKPAHVPNAENWLVERGTAWTALRLGGAVWQLGLSWDGAVPPDAAQQRLLTEFLRRCANAPVPAAAPVTTVALVQDRIKQVEDEAARLRAMQGFISESLAHMAGGVVIADALGQIQFANARARLYLGLAADCTMQGEPLSRVFDGLAAPPGERWEQAVQAALLRQETHQFSLCANDRDLWVQVAPYSGADTEAGLVISLADVTLVREAAHRAAEQSVQEEKERALITLRSVDEAVIATNPAGVIEYLNPAAQTLTGYSQEEAQDRPLEEVVTVIDEATGAPLQFPIQECMATGRPACFSVDSLLVRRDGDKCAIRASVAPIRTQDDKLLGVVLVVSDISNVRRLARAMEYQASHDALTGLPNRVLLQDRLKQAITEANRTGALVAVLFIDLDRFKHVNDALGHSTGDALLKAVGERLTAIERQSDTIVRLGGDEFVIVLEDLRKEERAIAVAQRVLRALAEPFVIDKHEFWLGGSIGISLYPRDGSNGETLLKNADRAMYRAKEEGGNNFKFYAQEMNVRTLQRLALERNLRHALERDEFELHYQPQVRLRDSRVIGLEALLRWRHPKLGVVPPQQFITLAEETGLIAQIGEWTLQAACQDIKQWGLDAASDVRIAINLSPRQFITGDIVGGVSDALRRSGVAGDMLCLELTEGMIMRDVEGAISTMTKLKALGIELAIDDFGTGYSSLSYLKRFPIDQLKIDQSFVRGIPADRDDAAIASAVIAMAHGIGRRVIAEGVETPEQLQFLQSQRCDEVQGFYVSQPLPAPQIAAVLRKGLEACVAETAS